MDVVGPSTIMTMDTFGTRHIRETNEWLNTYKNVKSQIQNSLQIQKLGHVYLRLQHPRLKLMLKGNNLMNACAFDLKSVHI